jgi:anti-sigma-K factor RskA
MARAVADRAGVTPIRRGTPAPPPSARPTFARWLAAAAIVVSAALLANVVGLRSSIQRLSVARAVLRDSTSVLAQRLAEQQATLDGLTGPGVRVMDAGATNALQPYGRMFWDQPTNRWTFVAYNLPAATAGRTYQLWLVTRDQKKVSAGTFEPRPNGSAIVRATYALAPDSLAAIAVTSEPAGGSAQPTTTPFLVGAAKSD